MQGSPTSGRADERWDQPEREPDRIPATSPTARSTSSFTTTCVEFGRPGPPRAAAAASRALKAGGDLGAPASSRRRSSSRRRRLARTRAPRRGHAPGPSAPPGRRSRAARRPRRPGAPRPGPGGALQVTEDLEPLEEAAGVTQGLELLPGDEAVVPPSTSPGRGGAGRVRDRLPQPGDRAEAAGDDGALADPRRARRARAARSGAVRRCGRSWGGRAGLRAGCARARGAGGSR